MQIQESSKISRLDVIELLDLPPSPMYESFLHLINHRIDLWCIPEPLIKPLKPHQLRHAKLPRINTHLKKPIDLLKCPHFRLRIPRPHPQVTHRQYAPIHKPHLLFDRKDFSGLTADGNIAPSTSVVIVARALFVVAEC